MREAQRQAATEAMVEWLAYPQELGKRPVKITCALEFDLHGMHYYVFKYKKSVLGKWLLGVCGGYENEQDTEHCGHVYSEMEEYSASDAVEKSIAMVEMIRAHWKQRVTGVIRDTKGHSLAFVLLDSAEWDKQRFMADIQGEWDITLVEEQDSVEKTDILMVEVEGMLVTISLVNAPVPDGEAMRNAATNYIWPQAVEETSRHTAHLIVAVLPRENDCYAANRLLVKLCDTCLIQQNAIGVYACGTVFQPEFYRQGAAMMHEGHNPLLNWIYFGLRQGEGGLMSGYTFGLNAFGKDEIEVLDSTAPPEELRNFLLDICAYLLDNDITLYDGETIGFSASQKLPITRSAGVNLEGETLKIGYKRR